MAIDPNQVGLDRTYKDATDAHDAAAGKYKDAVQDVPEEQRLPTSQMPKAPDPDPFKVGPMTGGER